MSIWYPELATPMMEAVRAAIAKVVTENDKRWQWQLSHPESTTDMAKAAQVRATIVAEREACAVEAEGYFSPATWDYGQIQPYTIGREIAAAIRARGGGLSDD